jgi:MerR family mercuric resistance operon transcriptional regulator
MPVRTKAGYRIYSEEDLLRLKFIKMAKDQGFSLSEISAVLHLLSGDKNINNKILNDQIASKIEAIDKKIKELTRLRETLEYLSNDANLGECDLLKFFYKTP